MKKRKPYFGLLISAIVLFCLLWILFLHFHSEEGEYAVVKVSGKVVHTLPLSKDTVVYVNGTNDIQLKIVVKENSVYVEHSDCPDKICEKKGKIARTNENIVCLPAQTVIEIQGSGEDEADVII